MKAFAPFPAATTATLTPPGSGRFGPGRFGDEWRTPRELFEALNEEFGFKLDAACTTGNCLAPRGLYSDRGIDARMAPWFPGPVWCNPPYSRLDAWMARAAAAGERTPVVMLVPADTSVRWWVDHVAKFASEVRFVVGRLRFRAPDGSTVLTKGGGGGKTTPSAVVVFAPGPRSGPRYSYIDRSGRTLEGLA